MTQPRKLDQLTIATSDNGYIAYYGSQDMYAHGVMRKTFVAESLPRLLQIVEDWTESIHEFE